MPPSASPEFDHPPATEILEPSQRGKMRPSGSSTRADSPLSLRVLGVPAEIDADKRLVTDHPGVMAGADRRKVASTNIAFGAVVHHDVHLPADPVDEVSRLAAVRAGDRLHVL